MINRLQLVKTQTAFNLDDEDTFKSENTFKRAPAQPLKKQPKKDTPAFKNSQKHLNQIPHTQVNNALSQASKKNNIHSNPLININNRISKLNIRLNNIETRLAHNTKSFIGYKELGLTLALATLIFTSLGLFFTNIQLNKVNLSTQIPMQHSNKNVTSSEDVQVINNGNNPSNTLAPSTPAIQHYLWPLDKAINNSELRYSNYKQGVTIPAKLGDPIRAIADGKVLFSEENFQDYGNLILVQHSNNIISVYGNTYSNYVTTGQTINKGDLLAAVGEAQGNIPSLYFEIRQNGRAQDPSLFF